MDNSLVQEKPPILSRCLPFLVAAVGILLSFCVWRITFIENATIITNFANNLHNLLHTLVLAFGLSLSILAGLAVRLIQLSHQHKKSFAILNTHFQNEIAERLHAEETKQKLEKALLQGQKLQAIGTLAGGIAHDFNNLLYAIIGYVEMARDDVATNSLVHKNLGKVLEASKRGQELIARILAFSRRQQHEFSPICLQQTIEGVLSLLRPTIPASVTITLNDLQKKSRILGNQTQLHQVLVNIINNAVDAMDGEGSVTINLRRIDSTDSILKQFPNISAGGYCIIEIKDTGHGMDQATLERIFEPFYTTKEVGKGTGLGLATVHSIMKEHHGEVIVESRLGQGSTFTLFLPEYVEQLENAHGKDFIS